MIGISKKLKECPKNGYFDKKIKNFHKSKVDGLNKLSTKDCLFNDFVHFKGCPYINHKISRDLSLTMTIFLTFHNRFMILVHMEVHSKK